MSTDPITRAREVLDARDAWGKTIAGSDECALASDAFTSALRRNGGALARAVHSLTAELDAYREENTRHREKIARVEALADQYDAEARLERREGDVSESINTQATADRIRAALNGGDQ